MNEKIKTHLSNYNKSKGWGTTDAQLMETITESKAIWEGKRDRHRWYTLIPTVVCVDGIFLQYDYCDVDGEMSDVEDCIGGYKIEDVIEVEPQEETITTYKPVV